MKKIAIIVTSSFLGLWGLSCSNNTEANSSQTSSNISTNELSEHKDGSGSAAIQDDESKPTVLKIAMSSDQHKILVEAVKAAELVDVLAAVGPYTVFAPTDEAFKKLPAGTVENLLKPENKSKLQDVLQYHVTTSAYTKDQLKDGMKLGMANGKSVTVTNKDGVIKINNATVIGFIEGANGNVFVIDEIIN
ncbi:MAG: hypothetical protein KatS3mg027_0416 [Bacteroidia bacterium]|nr:MAG: hypothetical protein KatS3mg027_0416 [Bacteroidia bacterium]